MEIQIIKNIEDIRQYLKNGFNKFFMEEKFERKNEIALNLGDAYSFSKEFLSTESSFYSRNNKNKVIYKHNDRADKKYFKITILSKTNKNNNISNIEIKRDNDKDDLKNHSNDNNYLKHIKKVQSLSDFPSKYNSQTYNSSNPFK